MSVVLWPRQEVLQLIIPQLGTVGKNLNNSTATAVVRKLSTFQSDEGKVSFDRWLSVAKELLKWNDRCIQLFWEMLSLASLYMNKPSAADHDEGIDLEYIAIFLVLHISEANEKKTVAPVVAYDTVWPNMPATTEAEISPTSPPASSPSKVQRKFSPVPGSPRSPGSPRNSSPSSPKRSPMSNSRTPRSTAQYLHAVRRKIPIILKALSEEEENTPDQNSDSGSGKSAAGLNYSRSDSDGVLQFTEFSVTRRIVDSLGLIVCGGQSREDQVPTLSMLLPVFTGEEALGSNAMKTSVESVDVLKDHSATINFSDLTAWFNLHLSMNDALYPHSLAPSYSMPSPSTPSSASSASASSTPTSLSSGGISSVGTPGSGISGGTVSQAVGTSLEIETKTDPLAYSMNNNNSLNSHRNQQPNRVVNAVSSLSKFVPTILSGCNTTVIHVLNSGISKQSSFRYKAKSRENLLSSSENTPDKSRHSSGGDPFSDIKKVGDVKLDEDSDAQSDSDIMSEINGSLNDHSMNAVTSSLVSGSPGDRMDDEDGRLSDEMDYPNRADAVKPKSLFINEKANGTALIASNKIETSLPQLFLNFCTRGNLYMLSPYYCASINGCMDSEIVIGAVYGACEFNVATLSTSIIAGDSRSLIFGPYNASYKNLRYHLRLAELQPLIQPISYNNEVNNANKTAHSKMAADCWTQLCDVHSCLDAAATTFNTSGYAVDMAVSATLGFSNVALPTPQASTASLLTPDKFKVIIIPFKQEALAFENCPIRIREEYIQELHSQRDNLMKVKGQILSVIADMESKVIESKTDVNARMIASSLISKKFMEWMVATDKAQHIMDLIKIDAEKMSNSNMSSNSNNGTPNGSQ